MFNFKAAFAVLTVTAGIASAAMPSWTAAAIPTTVKIGPTYSGNYPAVEDSSPAFILSVGGQIFVATYSGAKNIQMYELAKEAKASGKRIQVYHDADNTQKFISCYDYSATGCQSGNTTSTFEVIQELAIVN